MTSAVLVDASASSRDGAAWFYNLGLAKAANWLRSQGVAVRAVTLPLTMFDLSFDIALVSAIFSWHVPAALEAARELRSRGARVEVGGPGFFALGELARSYGFDAQASVDHRFDRQPGTYDAVFWSRGCPAKNCTLGYPKDGSKPVCLVPEMEGSRHTTFSDVTPAPIILDNNLSALPRRHQELVVERTLSAGFKKVDCNSGFEPHDWTERKLIDFQRWGNRLSYAMPFADYKPELNHSGVKARAPSVSLDASDKQNDDEAALAEPQERRAP